MANRQIEANLSNANEQLWNVQRSIEARTKCLHDKGPINGAEGETHDCGTVSMQLSFTLFINFLFIMKMNSLNYVFLKINIECSAGQ